MTFGFRVKRFQPSKRRATRFMQSDAANAGRFVGNPLEQHCHNDEHANSERLGSKPNTCDLPGVEGLAP